MYRFVIRKNYLEMLIGLDNKKEKQTMDQLSKEGGVNYFHLTTVMRQFQQEGIINREQDKNVIKISLTEKGKKIVKCLREIKEILEVKPKKNNNNGGNKNGAS